jgi:hypothetical protein
MGLVNIRMYGFIAIVALHEAWKQVLYGVLHPDGLRNGADVLEELPLLKVGDEPRILRPRAGELLDVGEMLRYLLLPLLPVLVVDRRPAFLNDLERVAFLLELVVETVDIVLCLLFQYFVDVLDGLIFVGRFLWDALPDEQIQYSV